MRLLAAPITEGWTEERRRPIPDGSGCWDKSSPGSGVEHTQGDGAEDKEDASVLSLLFIVSVDVAVVDVDDNELTGLDVPDATTETNEDDPEEAESSVSSSVDAIVVANWSVDVGESKHCTSFVVAPAPAAAAVVWRLSSEAAATKPGLRKTSRLVGSVGSRTRAKPSWLRRLRKEDIFRIPNNS